MSQLMSLMLAFQMTLALCEQVSAMPDGDGQQIGILIVTPLPLPAPPQPTPKCEKDDCRS